MFAKAIAGPAQKALDLISDLPATKDFYLAGGTGLAIQLGHRISVDLDFFTDKKFDPEQLLNLFSDAELKIENAEFSEGTLKFWLEETQISFFYYPYPLIEALVEYENIKLASPVEIALMKVVAIGYRGSKKDFIDLFTIYNQFKIPDLQKLFKKKYSDKIDFYQFLRGFTYFEDAEQDPDPVMLRKSVMRNEYNWSKVKSFFVKLSKEIQL